MSTEATFDPEVLEAIKNVRSDSTGLKYALCGHSDDNLSHVVLVATGTDTEEIKDKVDPAQHMYCLARLETAFDMSVTTKFVYIIWSGDKTSFIKRGRYGILTGSIEIIFSPYHIAVDTSSTDDLTDDHLRHQLMVNSGTMSKVLEDTVDSSGKPFQMRGFTQSQLPKRAEKSNFGFSAVSAQGAGLDISAEVAETVSQVRDDGNELTWMLAGYQDFQDGKTSVKGPLVCVSSGTGGVDELKSHLDESTAMYGLYRLSHTDEDEVTSVKFTYIVWVGPRVKPLAKGKLSTHKGAIEAIFTPAHKHIYATELSEINEAKIKRELYPTSH